MPGRRRPCPVIVMAVRCETLFLTSVSRFAPVHALHTTPALHLSTSRPTHTPRPTLHPAPDRRPASSSPPVLASAQQRGRPPGGPSAASRPPPPASARRCWPLATYSPLAAPTTPFHPPMAPSRHACAAADVGRRCRRRRRRCRRCSRLARATHTNPSRHTPTRPAYSPAAAPRASRRPLAASRARTRCDSKTTPAALGARMHARRRRWRAPRPVCPARRAPRAERRGAKSGRHIRTLPRAPQGPPWLGPALSQTPWPTSRRTSCRGTCHTSCPTTWPGSGQSWSSPSGPCTWARRGRGAPS